MFFFAEMLPIIPRTSLDLELDLQAQHSKLETLNDEIKKLKDLKQRYAIYYICNMLYCVYMVFAMFIGLSKG